MEKNDDLIVEMLKVFKEETLKRFESGTYKAKLVCVLIQRPFKSKMYSCFQMLPGPGVLNYEFKQDIENIIMQLSKSFTIDHIIQIEKLEDCYRYAIEEYGVGLIENNLYYIKDNKIAWTEESTDDSLEIT